MLISKCLHIRHVYAKIIDYNKKAYMRTILGGIP